ncbi:MAG: GNVR domain-containing protein [Nitrospira sp.]|nr:exopolysaccharide transport family protein [Nitrospira sp.]
MSNTVGHPETQSAPTGARSPFGLREHLITIFRQQKKLLTILGVATLVAGPGSFLMTNIYSAEVRLLIQNARTPFSMSTPLTGQVFTPSDITQKDDVATEVQIFTSPILLDKLVDYFGNERVLAAMRGRWDWVAELPKTAFKQLAGLSPVAQLLTTIGYVSKPEDLHYQAVQKIRAHLNVEGVRQTHVFVASLDSPDPDFSADALNALVGIYMEHQLSIRKGKGAREFFDEQTKQMRGELQQAEVRLQAFKDKWNIVSIEDQKRHLLQQVTHTEAALRESQVQVAETEVRITKLKERLAGQQEAIPLTNVSERNPMLDQLKNRLMQMELEYSQYVPDSPAAGELVREIAAVRARLQAESTKVTGAATSGLNQNYQELKRNLVTEEGRRESLRPRLSELTKQFKSYRDSLNTLDQREMELKGLMREVKVKQEAFDIYLKKEEESRINEVLDRKGISNVNAIEHAMVPQKPVQPRKFLNLVIGLMIGLVGGFGSAYVSEYMRRTFVTREEVEETLGRPVLAALPLVRPNTSDAGSFELELRQAAQHVVRSYHERGLRTLLITSALRGEGRSHVAGALAQALSEHKFRMLLITFEGAGPEQAASVRGDIVVTPGGDANRLLQDVPEPTDRSYLHRLRVRNREGTALEFAEHLAEVAKTMRDRFDLIVIDGPALTSFPEMRVAIAGIDGTILIIEAERTVTVAASRTIAAIETAGGHLLGLVLNKRRYIIPEWIYGRWLAAGGREGV